MAIFDKLDVISLGPKAASEEPVTVTPVDAPNDEEANNPDKTTPDTGSVVSENVQHGVANQQAITLSWTKKSLSFLFVK